MYSLLTPGKEEGKKHLVSIYHSALKKSSLHWTKTVESCSGMNKRGSSSGTSRAAMVDSYLIREKRMFTENKVKTTRFRDTRLKIKT